MYRRNQKYKARRARRLKRFVSAFIQRHTDQPIDAYSIEVIDFTMGVIFTARDPRYAHMVYSLVKFFERYLKKRRASAE